MTNDPERSNVICQIVMAQGLGCLLIVIEADEAELRVSAINLLGELRSPQAITYLQPLAESTTELPKSALTAASNL